MNWEVNARYSIGDKVKYNGKVYRCLQAHISNSAWTPEETKDVLWELVS